MKLSDWNSYFDYLSDGAGRLAKVMKEHKYIFSNDVGHGGSAKGDALLRGIKDTIAGGCQRTETFMVENKV